MEHEEHDLYGLNVNQSDSTKVKPLRQVEVIMGVEPRRSWSTNQKLSIVTESMVEGVVIRDVAARHELSPKQLFD